MIRNRPRSFFIALTSTCLTLGSWVSVQAADKNVAAIDSYPASHHIRTVFVILMENHNWTGDGNLDIKGNPAAPYINKTLLPMASHAEHYYNPPGNHPSLPNYLWLEAGTNFGIYNDNPPSQDHQSTRKHLVTQLENAGISWKSYDENITGKVCPLVDSGGIDPDGSPYYGVRHDPFVYFDDVTNHLDPHSTHCIKHVRPFTELALDLKSKNVASYNFITPNVCDDMHDNCAGDRIAHGDRWLSRNIPTILKSSAFQHGGAIFITWDEANSGDGPIGMIVLSAFAKGHGYWNQLPYTHGSTLRTVQEIFSLKPFLGDAARQRDLKDLFKVFP
jgi:phosphatidylinositol-3-phosphatase